MSESAFQPEPADGIEAVVAIVAGPVTDRTSETYKHPRILAPDFLLEASDLDDLTSQVPYAHAADGSLTPASLPFARLIELRAGLYDAEREWLIAAQDGKRAAEQSERAATDALRAGRDVPAAIVVDVAGLEATARAKYGALVILLRESRASYLAACHEAIPAARAEAAARLPGEIAAVRDAWSIFEEANAARWATVAALSDLNFAADPEYRGLDSSGDKRRDRKNGGALPVDVADLRRLDDQAKNEQQAVRVLADAVGSNDPLRTGGYVADAIGHGLWPVWFRRYSRSVDPAWLAGIEREHGVVSLDDDAAVEVESPTKRTRVRGK